MEWRTSFASYGATVSSLILFLIETSFDAVKHHIPLLQVWELPVVLLQVGPALLKNGQLSIAEIFRLF